MIKINDKAVMKKLITEDVISEFAKVSGDFNPIHLDEEYAASSMFKKRIAHGMISASFISNVIGNELPGNGTIYMSQTINFKAPVFIGDNLTVVVKVTDIQENGKIKLETICMNQNDDIVVSGEAIVKNKAAISL